MQRTVYAVNNGDGWDLDVKRYWHPDRLRPERPPLVFVPGYCMNTFILAFHPAARSMVEFLVDHGYEVWTANLRGQGDARRRGPRRTVSFGDWCDVDIPRALDFALTRSASTRSRPVLIGCSLGGTLVYGYLARYPENHRLSAAITLGAPLRWPALPRWATPLIQWPTVYGAVPVRGTRRLAQTLLPILRRVPPVLSIYMNVHHIELAQTEQLTQTVDDPPPGLNTALIQWLKNRDLIIDGTNVTLDLHRASLPMLTIYANHDGIVPPPVARAVTEFAAPGTVTTLQAGNDTVAFAHADMFINNYAELQVFVPMTQWLAETC